MAAAGMDVSSRFIRINRERGLRKFIGVRVDAYVREARGTTHVMDRLVVS